MRQFNAHFFETFGNDIHDYSFGARTFEEKAQTDVEPSDEVRTPCVAASAANSLAKRLRLHDSAQVVILTEDGDEIVVCLLREHRGLPNGTTFGYRRSAPIA
jgi:hypothetical protein